jgi:hypothetical protein
MLCSGERTVTAAGRTTLPVLFLMASPALEREAKSIHLGRHLFFCSSFIRERRWDQKRKRKDMNFFVTFMTRDRWTG